MPTEAELRAAESRTAALAAERLIVAQQAGRVAVPTPATPAPSDRAARLAAAAAAVAVAAGATPGLGAVVSPAVAATVAEIVATFARYLVGRRELQGPAVREVLVRRFPELPEADARVVLAEEFERHRVFAAKVVERLSRDLPAALALSDRDERRQAMRLIFDRERRYVDQHEMALEGRVVGRVDAILVRRVSPSGALWELDPAVDSCPACVSMAGKVWPWAQLEGRLPPLHPNCSCRLVSAREAPTRGSGLVESAERVRAAVAGPGVLGMTVALGDFSGMQSRDDALDRAVAKLADSLLRALTADMPFDAAWQKARATCVRSVAAADRDVTARVLLETEADWKEHYEAAQEQRHGSS